MGLECSYCTNVHSGVTIADVTVALREHALEVRDYLSRPGPLALGLWLSKTAATELGSSDRIQSFLEFLDRERLQIQTLNGFPAGDFHQSVVKHDVYQPTWANVERVEYTKKLIDILTVLLNGFDRGTISTLPLGWLSRELVPEFYSKCASNLLKCAEHAQRRAMETGRRIRLCLEPEPGCCLATSNSLASFFEQYLHVDAGSRSLANDFLGVCHDICHAVVMGETQASAVETYRASGVQIGKVQVSSALVANFVENAEHGATKTLERLRQFAEPRYLHQTMAGNQFFEDLPLAIANSPPAGRWRIHFHMPIYAAEIGDGLCTSQAEIEDCLRALWETRNQIDWEVETYAWSVLPCELQPPKLAFGIAKELEWLEQLADRVAVDFLT